MTTDPAAAAPQPESALPCALPTRHKDEPEELLAFRKDPESERDFMKLRRSFREHEDWRALATLLVLRAAHMQKPNKAAELCIQAYELWLERVRDKRQAAHALARAVILQPTNQRAYDRLRKLYDSLGWHRETVALLRWRLEGIATADPSALPQAHVEIAQVLEQQFVAVADAVYHYEQALALDPTMVEASDHLLRLYTQAGAWRAAADLIGRELDQPAGDPERVAGFHRQLARLESEHLDNVGSAARHLQAALQAKPDSIESLRAFGILYLGSGKATDEGMAKAADIFYKAAELARRKGEERRALKLLRRALSLRPDHQQASSALEQTLIAAEDWMALDDLYREWLMYFSGADAVPLLLRRADLLDSKLDRREEARSLYEEASRYQAPDDEAWKRLEEIYADLKDYHALAALLEAQAERSPEAVSTEKLLRIAQVYREDLANDERAAVFYYKVLEREPFNPTAFEGYKEHWRRKHNWAHLRDLVLYQIEQAFAIEGESTPLTDPEFAEEFVELADICERRLGDIDGSLGAWARMGEAYPADERPAQQMARIEKRARMWDNMVRVQEAELERAVDPRKRLDILKRLTQVYRDRQVNPDRAIELYNEILELSPNDIQATRALTSLYDRAGDFGRVVQMLRDQYERSRSNTERISLLRRMAELWHHELQSTEDAVWACEQILSHSAADREALHRLQSLYEEQGDYEQLLGALERELRVAASTDEKIKLLRRMARVAERSLNDADRAAEVWEQLLSLQPSSLQVTDKVMAVYEQTGRVEELGTLLGKAAASAKTPAVRQQDYLLRLGHLAESAMDDPDLARSAFERVLRVRPDHRGALEALVRLYRADKAWQGLATVLATLQDLAETDEDAFRIAWERSEIMADRLDDPEAAAKVLEGLANTIAPGHPEIGRSLLELYDRAGQPRKLVYHAELLLLASEVPDERRRLFEIVSETWLRHLDDKHAALAAYARFVDEFSDDLDGLWTMANLQQEVGDFQGTISTLERRLDLAADPAIKVTTLQHMADVSENGLQDPRKAIELLREALALDPRDESIKAKIDTLAETHDLWREYLAISDERFDQMGDIGDLRAQIDVCLDAARVGENRLEDPSLAFNWARRGYLMAVREHLDPDEPFARLEQLAESHGLWEPMLEVTEHELALREEAGSTRGDFDTIQRLLSAAEIAEHHLKNPTRAVAFLQRAHRMRPEDEELAQQLESTAELNELWDPIIELYEGRLERAETGLGRFDACAAIARVYEERRDDPRQAFSWLRRAWNDLQQSDASLADESFDLMVALAERHSLWGLLADHHIERSRARFSAGDGLAGLEAIQEAARIYDEQLGDPLGALRVLASGLEHDPRGDTLLAGIRRLGEKVDEDKEADAQPIGALAHLEILKRLTANVSDKSDKIVFLRERAGLREQRLGDREGAMAEWFRIFRIDPDDGEVGTELERIAAAGDLWSLYVLRPGWLLERSGDPGRQSELLSEIADLYEGKLSRPEYALRARLEGWRRHPALPATGELDEEHATLWRLAQETGSYQTPPVPKDPLLMPEITAPEASDQERWREAKLHPHMLEELPSTGEDSVPRAVPAINTEEVSLDSLVDMDEDEFDELEELEDFEEIDELEEIEDLVGEGKLIEVDQSRRAKPPPPPPAPPGSSEPRLPELSGALLPARPRVATGWDELAHAYSETPTANKHEKAEVALALARLWEEGADQVERAFQQHEEALLAVPELPEALEGIQALSDRHDATERLLQGYERLLSEAALPEHVVTQSLRIARLHEARYDYDKAEERYRGVLAVQPNHVEALECLCNIYDAQGRYSDFVEVFGELLEVQLPELDDDERIARTQKLAELLEKHLGRHDDAIERLEQLAREFPHRQEVHGHLARLLIKQEQWQKTIDVLRTASDQVGDEDYRIENLARIAEIYEERLKIPERAIEALVQVSEAQADDDAILQRLQRLYLVTSRFEEVLPIIDQRLDLTPDRDLRISLLVAKARALQEGMGNEEAATETLEQLVEEAPDNDEVVLGLSRLYRKTGRFEQGVGLLRERLETLGDAEPARHTTLSVALTSVLVEEAHDGTGALEVVNRALDRTPGSANLLRLRAQVARLLHDLPLLVESLSALPDPDGLLEAADIARGQLSESARAVQLYSKVLAESKDDSEDPAAGRRLAAAIEGLVRLRIDDGDIEGAMNFMDRQLGDMEGPSIRARLLAEMGRITYRSTGDIEAARARFASALEEDPDYAPAKLGLGEVLIQAGHDEEAEGLLESAVEALGLQRDQVNLVQGLVLLAEMFERTGRSGEGFRRLTTALRHDPDNLEIRAAIVRNRHSAERWRDAVTAVDQLEQHLKEGAELDRRQLRVVGEVLVLAADSEQKLRHPDKVLPRYRRALEVDPENLVALEAAIPLCHEQGNLAEAARYLEAFARQTEDEVERGRRFFDAGMFYHQAAAGLADGATETDEADVGVEALVRSATEALRLGLALAEQSDEPVLDIAQLEAAFVAAAGTGQTEIALRCLDRVLRSEVEPSHRHDLLLEGARIAIQSRDAEILEHADGYALRALEEFPSSAAAMLARASLLEATDRVDQIEALVEAFLSGLEREVASEEDREARVALFVRLAELQKARPEKAIEALERAAEVDPHALTPQLRHHMVELYDQVGRSGPEVITNHTALLQIDPLYVPSVSALAKHHWAEANVSLAYALYSVLDLIDPDNEDAAAFLAEHEVAEGDGAEVEFASLVPPPPTNAGVSEALLQLWDGGGALLGEHLPRVEVPQAARISPVGDTLIAQTWGGILKKLGQSKVALVDLDAVGADVAPGGNGEPAAAFFRICCQQPPVILAGPSAMGSESPDELRFALVRALFCTRPEAIFATGLEPETLARILSAMLQAFHPRHARRKHHSRDNDGVQKMSQEFARKLPIRVARQLSNLFKDRQGEVFDSRAWRLAIRQAASRMGLLLAGDLPAAVRVLAGTDGHTPRGEDLRDRVATDPELLDLIAFAATPDFVESRRTLGFRVRIRSAEED